MNESTARNIRVQDRYDELMRIGRHGHYETMFQVVREETEALRQQLAAALAACKSKDLALEYIVNYMPEFGTVPGVKAALAIQPDDSALKAWIGEPVAWNYELNDQAFNRPIAHGFDSAIPLYSPKGMRNEIHDI